MGEFIWSINNLDKPTIDSYEAGKFKLCFLVPNRNEISQVHEYKLIASAFSISCLKYNRHIQVRDIVGSANIFVRASVFEKDGKLIPLLYFVVMKDLQENLNDKAISKVFRICPFLGDFQGEEDDEAVYSVLPVPDTNDEELKKMTAVAFRLMRDQIVDLQQLEKAALDAACNEGKYVQAERSIKNIASTSSASEPSHGVEGNSSATAINVFDDKDDSSKGDYPATAISVFDGKDNSSTETSKPILLQKISNGPMMAISNQMLNRKSIGPSRIQQPRAAKQNLSFLSSPAASSVSNQSGSSARSTSSTRPSSKTSEMSRKSELTKKAEKDATDKVVVVSPGALNHFDRYSRKELLLWIKTKHTHFKFPANLCTVDLVRDEAKALFDPSYDKIKARLDRKALIREEVNDSSESKLTYPALNEKCIRESVYDHNSDFNHDCDRDRDAGRRDFDRDRDVRDCDRDRNRDRDIGRRDCDRDRDVGRRDCDRDRDRDRDVWECDHDRDQDRDRDIGRRDCNRGQYVGRSDCDRDRDRDVWERDRDRDRDRDIGRRDCDRDRDVRDCDRYRNRDRDRDVGRRDCEQGRCYDKRSRSPSLPVDSRSVIAFLRAKKNLALKHNYETSQDQTTMSHRAYMQGLDEEMLEQAFSR
jgi:hypothetical protein